MSRELEQKTELEQNEAAEQGSLQGWSERTGTAHTLFTGNTVGGWTPLSTSPPEAGEWERERYGARGKKWAACPRMVSVT